MPPRSDRPTTREAMRSANQLAVFDAIHRFGPISRVDLAAMLRLSPASLTDITAGLIDRRLVYEAREVASTGAGRRKVLLEVDYGHAAVVGIKVSNVAVHAALTDLSGEVAASRVLALGATDVRAVTDAVAASVSALRSGSGVKVVGVGVSVPGAVDRAGPRIGPRGSGAHR